MGKVIKFVERFFLKTRWSEITLKFRLNDQTTKNIRLDFKDICVHLICIFTFSIICPESIFYRIAALAWPAIDHVYSHCRATSNFDIICVLNRVSIFSLWLSGVGCGQITRPKLATKTDWTPGPGPNMITDWKVGKPNPPHTREIEQALVCWDQNPRPEIIDLVSVTDLPGAGL